MRYDKKRITGEFDFELFSYIFETAAGIVEELTNASKGIPKEKNYMADLIRRHSKLVCINIEEAWRAKEHRVIFLDRLSDAAQAASKTQDALKFASKNNYIAGEIVQEIDAKYEEMFEDIFIMLCDDKKPTSCARNNSKRMSAYEAMISV